ncbi:MAG TPA: toll/interleukin-1 receptor domain-containing protein [Thermoanaerobaculia bacterium]|jgi:hypothetical protein
MSNLEEESSFGQVPDIFTIITYSRQSRDFILPLMERLSQPFRGRLLLDWLVCDVGGVIPREQFSIAPEVCAVVLVLEPAGLISPVYQTWIRNCIEMVGLRDDLHLFICLYGMQEESFWEETFDEYPILRELLDTIHVNDQLRPEQLKERLASYLRQVQDIRILATWRDWMASITVNLGRLAALFQLASGLMLSMTAVPAMTQAFPGFQVYGDQVSAMLGGITSVPLVAFLIVLGRRARWKSDHRIWLWGTPLLLIGLLTVWRLVSIDMPWAWLMLGITSGTLLDSLRRAGYQARRTQLSLNITDVSQKASELNLSVKMAVTGVPPPPLTYPLLPRRVARVFLSYARNSAWGKETAIRLRSELKRNRLHPFMDESDMQEGLSWRRRLGREIAEAAVMICLADRTSVRRLWVAAEVETALRGRRLTGSPEVFILLDPQMRFDPELPCLPVFEAILAGDDSYWWARQPRVIPFGNETLSVLVNELGGYRTNTASVLPPVLGKLFAGIALPVDFLSSLGTFAGYGAALLWMEEKWTDLRLTGTLVAYGWLTPCLILGAFWFGSVARFALASQYEVRRDRPGSHFAVHFIAALGLTGIAALWLPHVSGLVVGWTLIAVCFGWLRGSAWLSIVGQARPGFLRSQDKD